MASGVALPRETAAGGDESGVWCCLMSKDLMGMAMAMAMAMRGVATGVETGVRSSSAGVMAGALVTPWARWLLAMRAHVVPCGAALSILTGVG